MNTKKKIITISIGIEVVIIATVIVFLFYNNSDTIRVRHQLELAQHYLLEEDYEQAIVAFESAIEIDPRNVEAYLGLAEAYVSVDELENAVKTLEKAAEQIDSEKNFCMIEVRIAEIEQLEQAAQRVVEVQTEVEMSDQETSALQNEAAVQDASDKTMAADATSGWTTKSEGHNNWMMDTSDNQGDSTAQIDSEVAIVLGKDIDNVEVRMPEVLGLSKEAAVSMLKAAGFVVNTVEEMYNSEYPEGQICYQSYEAGTNVSEGTVVDMKVSIGIEISTYNCSLLVQAPENYIGGDAIVTLMTADESQVLWTTDEKVTAFPVPIYLNNFTSPSSCGVIHIIYLINVEEIVIDADGNLTTQVSPQATVVRQNVQFTKN